MFKVLGILALSVGIAGCVAAQPYGYGNADQPAQGYYAPAPVGVGVGIGGWGGSSFGGGVGVGVGF